MWHTPAMCPSEGGKILKKRHIDPRGRLCRVVKAGGGLQMGPEWAPHRHNLLIHRLCLPFREENHQRRASADPRSGLCLLQSQPALAVWWKRSPCCIKVSFYFLTWIPGLWFFGWRTNKNVNSDCLWVVKSGWPFLLFSLHLSIWSKLSIKCTLCL